MKLVAAITALTDRSEVLSGLWLRLKLMVYVRRDALAKYMCSQIPSGSVIYDIGAHVGMYSVLRYIRLNRTWKRLSGWLKIYA
jgi:hypothetical protein